MRQRSPERDGSPRSSAVHGTESGGEVETTAHWSDHHGSSDVVHETETLRRDRLGLEDDIDPLPRNQAPDEAPRSGLRAREQQLADEQLVHAIGENLARAPVQHPLKEGVLHESDACKEDWRQGRAQLLAYAIMADDPDLDSTRREQLGIVVAETGLTAHAHRNVLASYENLERRGVGHHRFRPAAWGGRVREHVGCFNRNLPP